MKKIYLIFGIIFFALSAFAVNVKVLDYDPLPAKAGEYVDVFLSVENNQEATTKNIQIELIPKDSLRLSFGQEAVKDLGLIFGNKSSVVKYRLEVTADAVDGENFFEVLVKEQDERDTSFDLSIDVENKLPNIELGSVDSEPQKLLPDTDDVKLLITILNIGDGLAENLKTTLELPNELEFADSFSNQGLIGNLQSNSSKEISFLINIPKGTKAGNYKAKLIAEYTLENSSNGSFVEKELLFDISIKPVPKIDIISIQTTPQILSAGDRGAKLKLVLQNNGEADAESVRVKIFQKSEHPFEFEKTFDFVAPRLSPGETGEATLEFRVEDTANIQKYLLDLEIRSFVDDEVLLEEKVVELNVINARQESPNFFLLFGGALIIVLIVAILYWRRISKASTIKSKK